MLPKLPTLTELPQNVIAAMSKSKKTKKVSIPKIKESKLGKSMLKNMIKNAKNQVKGLSKTVGTKSKSPKLLKMTKFKAPKMSNVLSQGLRRLHQKF